MADTTLELAMIKRPAMKKNPPARSVKILLLTIVASDSYIFPSISMLEQRTLFEPLKGPYSIGRRRELLLWLPPKTPIQFFGGKQCYYGR
jgi:hypothetical protein